MSIVMACKHIFSNRMTTWKPQLIPEFSRSFSKSSAYKEKVGMAEFLNGVGKEVETQVAKLEKERGSFQKLVKKLGFSAKQRRFLLKNSLNYGLGLWWRKNAPVKSGPSQVLEQPSSSK